MVLSDVLNVDNYEAITAILVGTESINFTRKKHKCTIA